MLGNPDPLSVRCDGLLCGCSHLWGVFAAAEPAIDAAADLAQDGHAGVPVVVPRCVLAQAVLPHLQPSNFPSAQERSHTDMSSASPTTGKAPAAQQILAEPTLQAGRYAGCRSLPSDERSTGCYCQQHAQPSAKRCVICIDSTSGRLLSSVMVQGSLHHVNYTAT